MKKTIWMVVLLLPAAIYIPGQDRSLRPDGKAAYRVLNGFQPARLVNAVPATIPDGLRLERARLICAIEALIGADGKPTALEIVNRTTSLFGQVTIEAVKQSQFQAGSFKGRPVATRLLVYVPFLGMDRPAIPTTNPQGYMRYPGVLESPEAVFPASAPKGDYQVTVLIQCIVTEEGLPTNLWIFSPVGKGFDERAIDALKKYKFSPRMFDGVPIPMMVTIAIDFKRY